jgi:hypothetical protein
MGRQPRSWDDAGGVIFESAEAVTNPTEFCGACFDPKGLTSMSTRKVGPPRRRDLCHLGTVERVGEPAVP